SDIDAQRFGEVQKKLDDHLVNANKWRDDCINYFKKFSNMAVPPYEPPTNIKLKNQISVKYSNSNPIQVFNLQGKLISTITPKKDIRLADHKKMISNKLNHGIYIIRQKGNKPVKIVTGK
ncbi:MAG: T9SS type A sorting domain-containing protein, partial [Fibrobacter sp.]|nr:T9SS type A sorting domain-containing protein [Fibrobacter sp.]